MKFDPANDPREIPADVEVQYEGQWIAWDTVTHELVGHGSTMKEAMQAPLLK